MVKNAKGKLRLVIALCYVNQFLNQYKFKYEGLDLISSLFKKGNFAFSFDLKSGYHHVDIHKESQPYLGFSWGDSDMRKFYFFCVLPFGLSTACYVFTKLLRPLVKRWRSMGLRAIVYIDDGICASNSESEAVLARDLVVSDLNKAGFVLNVSKSHLEPVQIIDWLGFTVDLKRGCFSVPQHKIDRLKLAVMNIPLSDTATARCLASIVGQIISMSIAIGPISRLRTRALYSIINQRIFWSDRLFLSLEAQDELKCWQHNIAQLNGWPIWFSPSATRVAYSDASSTGCGGYVVELGPEISHGQWSIDQANCSSTWRELRAVDHVLRSFAPKLQGHTIRWLSDNQNIVRIIQYGSKKPHLQDGAMSIFETCFQYSIKLGMDWIPRSDNDIADYISKVRDFDDWKINPAIFDSLDRAWGLFQLTVLLQTITVN